MKHNFKTERTPGSFAACNAFYRTGNSGACTCLRNTGGFIVIETWDNDKTVDYGYRFDMKFQPGITTYESFGCDNLDREAFSDNGKSERDTECVECSRTIRPEAQGCVITM